MLNPTIKTNIIKTAVQHGVDAHQRDDDTVTLYIPCVNADGSLGVIKERVATVRDTLLALGY